MKNEMIISLKTWNIINKLNKKINKHNWACLKLTILVKKDILMVKRFINFINDVEEFNITNTILKHLKCQN